MGHIGITSRFFRNLLAIAKLLRETVERPRRDLRAILCTSFVFASILGFRRKKLQN